MRATKIKILKIWNIIIAGILSILGFASSCKDEPLVEYGSPHAKFIVNGTVTDKTTQTPIQNIRVIMTNNSEYSYLHDTAYTDSNGNYEVIDNDGFPTNQTYKLYFQDIDDETNGNYLDVDSVAEFIDPKFTGKSGWYSGETSKKLNIKMSPEE